VESGRNSSAPDAGYSFADVDNFRPSASRVYQLVKILQLGKRGNWVLDNFFTNIPLLEAMRKIGIGAAGTTQVDAQGFPLFLKIEMSEAKMFLP